MRARLGTLFVELFKSHLFVLEVPETLKKPPPLEILDNAQELAPLKSVEKFIRTI